MEKKSITSKSFVRMSEDIFEHDGDTIERLRYLFDTYRYPSLCVDLPLRNYHGYMNMEFARLSKGSSLVFRMYSSRLIHPLMRCFINGVPSSKEVKIVFDGIRILISHLNQYRENLDSIGWEMSSDEGGAFRKVNDDLEIRVQRTFSKGYETLIEKYTDEDKVSSRASENVFFMTEEFQYFFLHEKEKSSYFCQMSGWDLFSSIRCVETQRIPQILENSKIYPEYSFYTPLEHISGLPRNLIDLLVSPLKCRAIGKGFHFSNDGQNDYVVKGLMIE